MAGPSYHNLDVTIGRDESNNTYRARILTHSGVSVTSDFPAPLSDPEFQIFRLIVGSGRRRTRRIDNREIAEAKVVGERLFNSLFSGGGLATL
ncbi:MAG TPA: hypothetical protein VGE04_13450, partial [Chloroflexia bacterium]